MDFSLDQFTLLILYIAVISTFIINKLKKVMESVKDFKDQLAANNQLVQAATGKLTELGNSLLGIKGDIKTLNDKITVIPPAEDGSVTISKDDWEEIKSLAGTSTTSIAALADQATAEAADAKAIDDLTPETTAPVTEGN